MATTATKTRTKAAKSVSSRKAKKITAIHRADSFAEVHKDALGAIASGVSDLATNKEYLRGRQEIPFTMPE